MVLKEFFRGGVKHALKLVRNPDYRTWCLLEGRYSHYPRFRDLELTADGLRLHVPDSASFLSSWREIFYRKIYQFQCLEPNPVIVDLGANIGLSVIFFKRLFPKSCLVAYEADPYIFRFLQENVSRNVTEEVSLYQKAVWDSDGCLQFRSDHADGGTVVRAANNETIQIASIDIRRILSSFNRIDLLKMDIEGAERTVIPATGTLLDRVQRIFVEYHSSIGDKQHLAEVLHKLEETGFRLTIETASAGTSPFQTEYNNSGFDLQLNIWGKR